ncbi:hypothetical protein [Acidovorax sp. LjRoot117]|uniref:hypothetical protein n=1 Tax=Acidovorax sp. LjRoot117 TaxID=3342255 RepID=UPI003ECD9B32
MTNLAYGAKKLRWLWTFIVSAFTLSASAAMVQTEPAEFSSLEAAKIWFAQAYPRYEVESNPVRKGEVGQIVTFYGMQGSGIIRAVGWYYACGSLGGDCQLLTVVHLGEIKSMKSKPTAVWSGTHLVVRVDGREVGRVKVPK